jgi:hypothetical protein
VVKILAKPEEIISVINQEIANSNSLDEDCRKCRVKSLSPASPQEMLILERNWSIGWTNKHNWSLCETNLIPIIKSVGDRYEADWD